MWGNAKVPRIELLKESGSLGGWVDTSDLKGMDSFASTVGIAIDNLPSRGLTSLTIETSYSVTNCSALEETSEEPQLPSLYATESPYLSISCPDCPKWDSPTHWCIAHPHLESCQRLMSFLGLEATRRHENRMDLIVYMKPCVDKERPDECRAVSAHCSVSETRVETKVRCQGRRCRVNAVRASETDLRSSSLTPFDSWAGKKLSGSFRLCPRTIFIYLNANGEADWDFHNLYTTLHLADTQFGTKQLSLRTASLLDGGIRQFIGWTGRAAIGPAHEFLPEYAPRNGLKLITQSNNVDEALRRLEVSYLSKDIPCTAGTNATTTEYTEVYDPVIFWVVVSLTCSSTAVVVGLLGLICDLRSLAPRMFEPALSFTCDEKFGIEPGGTTLDADDRATLLGDMRCRLGDLRPEAEVGYIGFALEENVARLKAGRLYM
ncbi:hypothetical protein F5Y18DRAFT_392260 [Xylariaceae sp. FL1019]|nr:hypothetical protein F5Y18DRAFT_392260 [Xylariaceae sp. FL1019]